MAKESDIERQIPSAKRSLNKNEYGESVLGAADGPMDPHPLLAAQPSLGNRWVQRRSGAIGRSTSASAGLAGGPLESELGKRSQGERSAGQDIGETEKNLERLFSEAQDSDVIVFLDKADARFGKPPGVSHAHDPYANIETAYLLQRTEHIRDWSLRPATRPRTWTHPLSGASTSSSISAPEEPEHLEIWRRAFPREAPQAEDLDLEFLAHRFKTIGGNIRNIVLASPCLAGERNSASPCATSSAPRAMSSRRWTACCSKVASSWSEPRSSGDGWRDSTVSRE